MGKGKKLQMFQAKRFIKLSIDTENGYMKSSILERDPFRLGASRCNEFTIQAVTIGTRDNQVPNDALCFSMQHTSTPPCGS